MKQPLTRRRFLKMAAVATAASYAPVTVLAEPVQARSRVILASHAQLVDANEQINARIVRAVVDETLIALTGTPTTRDAWLTLLPRLQPSEVIGIKVNCINSRQSSHPQVVYALAQSLVEAVAFNPNHVIIWDRTSRELKRARYTHNTGATGIRCLATSDDIGYDKQAPVEVGNGRQVRLSKILSQMCTYLINVPVLKDHGIAGLTLSLKNHYGSIDRPGACHGNRCDPYVANLNAAPQIREKTKLIVCDALYGIYSGGPSGSPQWINRQLLAGTDPVALDYTGLTLIDQQRRERGMGLASARTTYLQTAAALGLGQVSPRQIEMLDMQLG
jgi:uncharacterized protein (DUF362 family)